MRTLRTVVATLAAVFLISALACVLLLSAQPELLRRTVYYLCGRGRLICLIMGLACLAIFLILTLTVKKSGTSSAESTDIFDSDEDFEEEEDETDFFHSPKREVKPAPRKSNKNKSGTSTITSNAEDDFSFEECTSLNASYNSGKENPTEASFRCMYCGAKLSRNSKFCERCGKKL